MEIWNESTRGPKCRFVLLGSRNEIQTIPPSKQTETLPTLLVASKNEGPSHAGEANFDKGPRTVSV